MITGAYTTAVIVAASMVAPVLAEMGIPKVEITAIIALGSTLGMIAPPVNIPAMLMGGGIDMPFVGFGVPLLLLTLPLAVFSMLYLSLKHVSRKETDLRDVFCSDVNERYGFKVYLPIIVVVLFMSINKLLPGVIPDIGLPLTFVIGSIVAIFTGKKINILKSAKEAVYMSLPVMGVLAGVGILIQIMTLTGVRGFIVIRSLDIPEYLLYLVIAAVVPLLGAISTFGSASVLGVPLLLALISKNQIIVASALSLLAGIGGLLPPLGFFAADAVGNDYNKVLKAMVVPIVIYMILSVLFIVFANQLAAILF